MEINPNYTPIPNHWQNCTKFANSARVHLLPQKTRKKTKQPPVMTFENPRASQKRFLLTRPRTLSSLQLKKMNGTSIYSPIFTVSWAFQRGRAKRPVKNSLVRRESNPTFTSTSWRRALYLKKGDLEYHLRESQPRVLLQCELQESTSRYDIKRISKERMRVRTALENRLSR